MSSLNDQASVDISTKGDIAEADRDAARKKFSDLAVLVREPVRGIDIRLIHERNPANERPFSAEVVFNVDGRPVRAHVTAEHMREAIDIAADSTPGGRNASVPRPSVAGRPERRSTARVSRTP